jgi:HEAT repeat protein
MSDTQLSELVEVLTWDGLSLEQKLGKLMEGQLLFELPAAKVLAFLRELLEAGRQKDFLRLLNRFAMGLAFPAVVRRAAVAKAFEAIADWVDIPGMPAPVMKELMDILARAYSREKDPEVHRWFSLGVEHLLWFWVQEGSPERAEALFSELQDIVTELSLPAPWKEKATLDLLGRLGSPERIDQVLLQLFQLDREAAAVRVHPYLRMLGSQASNHLVERLWEEKDRARRGRLLEALKDCGQTAEAPLLESLKSSEWFVVRNALVILGDIASPESLPDLLATLKHPDPRVVRAAVLAVGRLGGRQAEAALIPLVSHRDPATQMEVLFALADMKAKNAVPALVELCRLRGRLKPAQERVREKAVEILGKLGSPTAIPALEALLVRKKGFFGESREPAAVRILAFRSLLALGMAEALRAADLALSVEPPGEERDAFMAGLDEI